MIVECFLDTNILLYAASVNPAHGPKKKKAIELIAEKRFALSAQVFQEFYVNATRKSDFEMTPGAALEWMENLEEFPCLALDVGLVNTAASMAADYQISYWDAAILAAAQALEAPIVYTEDLNHGQAYGAVRVINPFFDLQQRSGFHENSTPPFVRD